MRVKLYTKAGGFVTEGDLAPFNEPPEVLFWGLRVFIRNPFRIHDGDSWVRYSEAWATSLVTEEARSDA